MKRLFLVCGMCLLFAISAFAGGQQAPQSKADQGAYPSKNITMIVPYAAGGGSDMITRFFDKYIKSSLGYNFTFTYKEGAGGAIGTSDIARAPKDGYTIGTINVPHVSLQSLTGAGSFSTSDFTYICQAAISELLFVTPKGGSYTDLNSFIQAAKADPGKLTIGIAGALGDGTVAAWTFMEETGAQITPVNYSGGADVLSALLGNHIDAAFYALNMVLPEKEKMNLLSLAYTQRNKNIPDIPTFLEQGYDIVSYSGRIYVGPAGMPAAAAEKLEKSFKDIFEKQDFQADMEKGGFTPGWMGSKDLQTYVSQYDIQAKELLAKYNTKK